MARIITKGTTNVSDYIYIQDSADGTAETGITVTTLDMQYVRDNTAPTTKVDATAGSLTAHSDNTIVEVDATDQPGLYKVDWPDAAFATGVDHVVCTVVGTGFAPVHREFILADVDIYDSVRAGMTALPNAAAGTASGLPNDTDANGRVRIVDGTGAGELQTASGRVDANVTHYGGVAGTFGGGLPEVNLAQWLGAAPLGLSSQRVQTLVGAMGAGVMTAAAVATDAIDADALATDAINEIRDAIDAMVVETEGSYTLQQALSIILSFAAGRTNTGGTVFNTPNNVATRISATTDASNNRTAMTLTPST